MFNFIKSFITEFTRAFVLAFMGVLLGHDVEQTDIEDNIDMFISRLDSPQGLDYIIPEEAGLCSLFDKNTSSMVGFLFKGEGKLFVSSFINGELKESNILNRELVVARQDGTILVCTFTKKSDEILIVSSKVLSPATEYWTEVEELYNEHAAAWLSLQLLLFKDNDIVGQIIRNSNGKVFVSQNHNGKQVPFTLFNQELHVTLEEKCLSFLFSKKDNGKVVVSYTVK